jgi:hypothetical protein
MYETHFCAACKVFINPCSGLEGIIHVFDLDFSIRFESIRNAQKTRSSLIMCRSSLTISFSVDQVVLVVLLWILVSPN